MEQKEFQEDHSVLHHLSHIAPQMLRLRDQANLPEFVLHELCCNKCLNLEKAAYFVDNPDFDCLKGVAGYSRTEEYPNSCSIWEYPEAFSTHMGKASFNQKVRSVKRNSVRREIIDDALLIREMAHNLEFKNYNFYSWDMKHDNHGILLFEQAGNGMIRDNHLKNGVSLLSFCPIY